MFLSAAKLRTCEMILKGKLMITSQPALSLLLLLLPLNDEWYIIAVVVVEVETAS